ncbi:MAG: efflux RND transporter permease subunit [Pelagimonas sp.]|nr:efflux RND transporter permease subunit [Pelagimonas sp.]
MSLARGAINNALLTWLVMLGCLLGGWWGFNAVGRLEDPAFSIKEVVVITQYPGADSEQVAREVSEPLETALQQMSEVKEIRSTNRPGVSVINVEVQDTFDGSQLPAIWADLRNRVADAALNLNAGVGTPWVNDKFGDVFGVYYAVTAQGYTDAEIHDIGRFLRRELLVVDGVANVEVASLPQEAIFVDVDLPVAYNMGVSPSYLQRTVQMADSVTPSGQVDVNGKVQRLQIADGSDTLGSITDLSIGTSGGVIKLVDVAHISRGRVDHPAQIIRYNGVEAFTLGVAGLNDRNIVEVGLRVEERLAELKQDLPVGVEISPIYEQHRVVDEASNAFLVNLGMSVGIVVVVLAIFMGWRAAVVVGVTLLLTVVGTLFFMAIFSIEMERISLGALIIAMGMLVDNAIVVAEGMQIAMAHGKTSRQAAYDIGGKTQFPLLGATVIGIMAFSGIGLSPDATGEFLFSLFACIGISLMLSWILAMTATPLLAHYFFKTGNDTSDEAEAYSGFFFRSYARSLRLSLRLRWLVAMALGALTVVCFIGFGQVKQQFFPNSNTPIFFVHYKLPQGTSIGKTSEEMAKLEDWFAKRDDIVSTATFVGQGASRFILTYGPEPSDPSYGFMIVRTETRDEIPPIIEELRTFAAGTFAEGMFRTERLVFGPGGGAQVEVRFSGRDPNVLRALAEEAMGVMQEQGKDLRKLRTDWHEREITLRPRFATDRAETAGISRDDVATALLTGTQGIQTGVLKDGSRQVPIYVRAGYREDLPISQMVVFSQVSNQFVPLEQVIDGWDPVPQDTILKRLNRVPTITIQAGISDDVTAVEARADIVAAIEAIELPPGYKMEWGGEFEASGDAQAALGATLPVTFLVMVLISVVLFGALRQPLVIWLLVPMSVNGVALGLLGTGLPFSFTALLGLLSLSGMLIKNGIVLVEEIDLVRAEGVPLEDAIVKASVSRIRPVFLAAATTILGMLPLLSDAFFASMAVTIMGGLAFASILTLVAAPVFYMMFYNREEKRKVAAAQAA